MRKRYGWEYGIPAYVAATFVAYSRVESDQHYTRDVIAGAVIGIVSSYLFTDSYKGWQIQPDVDYAHYGVRLLAAGKIIERSRAISGENGLLDSV